MTSLSPNEALLRALEVNNDNDVIVALENGADVNPSSSQSYHPLHVAVLTGTDSIINILLSWVFEKCEHTKLESWVDQTNTDGYTPLMVAALNGKTNAVRMLLARGAEITKCLDTGETALHLAMKSGSQETVIALLDGPADINVQTRDNRFTPLHFAAHFNALDLANILLDDECNAEIQDSQGRTAAMVARDEGHKYLAEHIDKCTMKGSRVDQDLVTAVMDLDDKAARQALAAGANANLLSPTGSCILHAAALRGSPSLVKILLQHGSMVNQADFKGFTPLMVAALNGRTNVVKALLENGADKNLKRPDTGYQEEDTGETALHMAMAGGSPGVVRALLEGEVDINAQTTKEKFTPLHFAAQFDARDMMKILQTDTRCDVKITDSKGRTAAQLVEESGKEDTVVQNTPGGSMTKVQVITSPKPMQPSDSVHKVTTSPRGRVLVLNYEKFETQKYRNGAVWDNKKLRNLFAEMGYDVIDMNKSRNLTYQETKDALKSFRDSKEMKDVDCAIVCVLSHGMNKNTFITSDFNPYIDSNTMTVEEVYEYFTDENCPNLKGKPKLFLFNFCRKEESTIQEAKVKINKDILKERIAIHGCKEGFAANRHPWKGTRFAEIVVRIFSEHAHNLPVDKLAEKMNEYMKTEFEETMPPADINTSRKFYLNPKRKINGFGFL